MSGRRGFLAALLALVALYLALALPRASRSSLRGDEAVTLEANWRGQSWGDLLLRGARIQVSPSPLTYVVDKAWDASRVSLGWLGLSPSGYVRLPAVLFTAALGFAAAFAVSLRVPPGQGPLPFAVVLCALAGFYFHPKAFLLSCTERPYALWNALWLFLLAWLLGRPPVPRWPLLLLVLLALTATGSCFQILALGIAILAVRGPRDAARLLALPALIAAYYALRSDFGEPGAAEAAPRFWRFWIVGHLEVWIAAAAAGLLLLKRPALRQFSIPAIAVGALLLLAPVMYGLSQLRGIPFASRQFLWSATALPTLLFLCAAGWDRLAGVRGGILLAALAFAVASLSLAATRPSVKNDSRELRLLEASSPLMRGPRPAALLHAPELGPIERANLRLIAEWIAVKRAGAPEGPAVAVVDRDGALIAEEAGLREGWIRVPVERPGPGD